MIQMTRYPCYSVLLSQESQIRPTVFSSRNEAARGPKLHRYHRNPEICTARAFDGGQKLNPTFWSNDCRTPYTAEAVRPEVGGAKVKKPPVTLLRSFNSGYGDIGQHAPSGAMLAQP